MFEGGGASRLRRSTELAALPSKPELYAKLLSVLQAPMTRLAIALNGVHAEIFMNVLAQIQGKKKRLIRGVILAAWARLTVNGE